MGRFAATYSPKSTTGGVNDVQNATVTAASSAEIVVGFRQLIRISNGSVASATIKFGVSGMGAATATDAILGANQYQDFEMGDEFDRLRIFSAGTTVIVTVMRMTP